VKRLLKEPNDVLVMTTCKCREHGTNLVMTRTWFDETLQSKIEQGVKQERERVLEILNRLPFIWGGTTQMIQTSRNDVIALIKGEN
jgi:hypothetical protein